MSLLPLLGLTDWTGGHLPSLLEATRTRDGTIHYTPSGDCTPVVDSERWLPELSPDGFVVPCSLASAQLQLSFLARADA